MEMKRKAFISFSSLEDNFNVGNLRTQDTTSFDKLTTFTLDGVVSGGMVALNVLCDLKSFLCVPEPRNSEILTMFCSYCILLLT